MVRNNATKQKNFINLRHNLFIIHCFPGLDYPCILMTGFLSVEKNQIVNDTLRAPKAVYRMVDDLESTTKDWAHYDDAFDFVDGKNPSFVENNITVDALATLNVNLFIYFNRQGKIVFGVATQEGIENYIPFPKGLEKYIQPNSPLVNLPNPHQNVKGLIYLPSGIIIVAASGLSNAGLTKSPNGTLLTGQFFSLNKIEKLNEITSLTLTLFDLQKINSNKLLKLYFDKAIDHNGRFIYILDENTIYGYSLLRDIYQNPIGMIRVAKSRDVYHIGMKTTRYFLGMFIIIGILLSILIWYLLQIFFIKRLKSLTDQIQNIRKKKNYRLRVSYKGSDELSNL